MRTEREIAGFALPFTLGILLSAYITLPSYLDNTLFYSLIPTITCIPLICLMHPAHLAWNKTKLITVIACAGLTCGLTVGITGTLTAISGPGDLGHLWRLTNDIGNHIRNSIRKIPFSDQEINAVISALLTGDRSDIPPEIIRTFRNSGASHILALSGLHLGIIYSILQKSSALIGNSIQAIRLRSTLIIIVCSIYSMATGAGDSISRALLFIIIREAANVWGRKISIGGIFFCALIIQLTHSPLSCRSAGFQLSYAAIAGIAFIFPYFNRLWNTDNLCFNPIARIWKSAAISISCQLTTGPLAWLWFGAVPKYFLMTNLIAVPLAGLIIPTSLLTLTLHSFGICPDIITRATECLVSTLTDALEIISSM